MVAEASQYNNEDNEINVYNTKPVDPHSKDDQAHAQPDYDKFAETGHMDEGDEMTDTRLAELESQIEFLGVT